MAKIYRISDVKDMVGLSRSSIYAMMEKGTFPKQVRLGERSVGWLDTAIDEWIMDRVSDSQEVRYA